MGTFLEDLKNGLISQNLTEKWQSHSRSSKEKTTVDVVNIFIDRTIE
jgi:hypothetical protein